MAVACLRAGDGVLRCAPVARCAEEPAARAPLDTAKLCATYDLAHTQQAGPAAAADELARHDAFFKMHYAWYPPRQPSTPVASKPIAPSLAAFTPASVMYAPGSPLVVLLRCKDPAHPTQYLLRGTAPDGPARISAVAVQDDLLTFSVSRGEEVVTFRHRLRDPTRRTGLFALRGAARSPLEARTQRDTPSARPADQYPERVLACVPFYREGKQVGIRLTGVKHGSWAEARGLRPGDVIETARNESPDASRGIRAYHLRLRNARAITVKRRVEGRWQVIALSSV